MDGDTGTNADSGGRSPKRTWPSQQHQHSTAATPLQQQHHSPTIPQHHSPRTPQSAHALRTMILPIHHGRSNSSSTVGHGYPRTPLTAQPASSSLAALLEAKNIASQTRLDVNSEDKWRRLGSRILPLFNGDRMQGTVEENNEMVRGCLRTDGDNAWQEISGILRVGMASVVRGLYRQLNVMPRFEQSGNNNNNRNDRKPSSVAMLSVASLALDDGLRLDNLVDALAVVWSGVYSHVLPYLEAVFLPLSRFRGADVGGVRVAVLKQFRDCVVMPLLPRLQGIGEDVGSAMAFGAGDGVGSLAVVVQMLTVLAALNPTDRGPLYVVARTLAAIAQS
ncbi:hypothetical protein IWW45_002573 [Coemansia sp. RSA 485]|nr:hypothetical protein IWW45_002573 [Coemansia sp. RSA 485]